MTGAKDEQPAADWVHLPAGCESLALWVSLHDGILRRCTSDLVARTVILDIDVPHLEDAGSPFVITIGNVTSVRASVSVRPPGEHIVPTGLSIEDQQQLLAAYYTTFREQSLRWEDFEHALATDPLDIMGATLAKGDRQVALCFEGFLDGDRFDHQYAIAFIRGERITIRAISGELLTVEEFVDIGGRYWDRFGRANS